MQRNGVWRRSIKRSSLNGLVLNSQLNRSPSFNSSGCGSNYDAEDVFSDNSLEEDVGELNNKVESLERQVCVLTEQQRQDEDRYSRCRNENSSLHTRLQLAEEQLRELELRSREQLEEERQRNRQLAERVEREHQLQLENVQLKLQCAAKQLSFAELELERERSRSSDITSQHSALQQQVLDCQSKCRQAEEAAAASERQTRHIQATLETQQASHQRSLAELRDQASSQVESSRQRLEKVVSTEEACEELATEVRRLSRVNTTLQERYDELHVQLLATGLREGRQLLADSCGGEDGELVRGLFVDQIDGGKVQQMSVNCSLADELQNSVISVGSAADVVDMDLETPSEKHVRSHSHSYQLIITLRFNVLADLVQFQYDFY